MINTKKGQKIVSDPSAFSVSINQSASKKQWSAVTPKSDLDVDYSDSNNIQYPDYTCL